VACEVRMYCDTCGTNMLVDEHGRGSFREAMRDAIANAKRCGFRRTKRGWQCPGCLVGFPNVFDIDDIQNDKDRAAAHALLLKRGIDLSNTNYVPRHFQK
jgi:hypothetical protein